MPRPRRWTDDQLAEAVTASTTLSEVCRRIGIRPGGYDVLRQHIARIGVEASHLKLIPGRRWTDDQLREAVADAVSVAEVQRALGYRVGGTHRMIVGHIQRLGLDTSHFLGRAWSRGRRLRAGSATFGYVNMPDASISEVRVVRRRLRAGARGWGWQLGEVFYENRAGSTDGFERMQTALRRGEGKRVVITSFTHFSSGLLGQSLMLQSLENDLSAEVVALDEDGVPRAPGADRGPVTDPLPKAGNGRV